MRRIWTGGGQLFDRGLGQLDAMQRDASQGLAFPQVIQAGIGDRRIGQRKFLQGGVAGEDSEAVVRNLPAFVRAKDAELQRAKLREVGCGNR